MLNKSGESDYPCLIPNVIENTFKHFPLSMILAVDLSYMAFVMLRKVPSVPTFWRVFIINGC